MRPRRGYRRCCERERLCIDRHGIPRAARAGQAVSGKPDNRGSDP
jgi:hypothetical protein